ncbi:MAG: glycoside hydrolase family 2 protein [Anaerolineae bacterium]
MNPISLDGAWQLIGFPEAERRVAHPDALPAQGGVRVPAQVPGNVELDLQSAGVLPDPFYGANIRLLRPYEYYEWWLVRSFDLPAAPDLSDWTLVLAGVDCIATVWVNGIQVAEPRNALIEHRVDVSKALRWGETNRIAVRISSALNEARRYDYDALTSGSDGRQESPHIRKAPHSWGWDIMPRAASAGLWRSVWLEPRPATAIERVYYYTEGISHEGATLGVQVQFRTADPTIDGYALRFRGVCGDHRFAYTWPCDFTVEQCRVPVPGAKLWWPKGYGDPNLYTVTLELLHEGRVVAERTDRIGLRKLVVDRTEQAGAAVAPGSAAAGVQRVDQPADPESHFVFCVNDTPIMIKGSNWVPLDAFHSRDAGRYDRAVALFDDLGCNMIRCWGGNTYEDHRFFDLCDEKGLLVWQDFAYACSIYPQTEEFLEQVRAEAESIVPKLRNHPSLALWCGDNEIDAFYVMRGLDPAQNRLTREVLPRVAHRLDPHRHYVPSSPYVPPSLTLHPNVWTKTPEQHLWGPRGYYKGPFYTQHSAHFIGEMGYHGCPNVSSIQRFISPEKLWPWKDNEEWRIHDVTHLLSDKFGRDRIKLMANQVQELFGAIPEDLASFALASQITQAEAKKFFVESTRLRKWRTSGVLWWNVIDGWPQFSDAIVDYFFGVKLAYHYLWRSQRPVCLIVGEPGPDKYLPLVLANDTLRPVSLSYRVWDADGGETVAEGQASAGPNENWQVNRLRTYASDQRLYLISWELDGVTYGNHYLAGTPPMSLERYRGWLERIAELPRTFDAAAVAR